MSPLLQAKEGAAEKDRIRKNDCEQTTGSSRIRQTHNGVCSNNQRESYRVVKTCINAEEMYRKDVYEPSKARNKHLALARGLCPNVRIIRLMMTMMK